MQSQYIFKKVRNLQQAGQRSCWGDSSQCNALRMPSRGQTAPGQHIRLPSPRHRGGGGGTQSGHGSPGVSLTTGPSGAQQGGLPPLGPGEAQ